ncbi:MAG TPA: hypothetical protein VHT91_13635 [Kofleriaceae bacterium]|jgi:hypothetical protein|nr:hypothetical protein [Kofleriaceae bacterium]
MKSPSWLSLAIWACAASGCSSTMPGSPQPIGFTFNTTEGSFASFGWSGAVHDVAAPPDTPFEVKTTECDNDVCRFAGPVASSAKVDRRRCLFRMSKTCTADGDCPLDHGNPTQCVYVYDTPIATPLPGADNNIGACAWSYIPLVTPDGQPTITGTLNLATGALKLESFTVLLPLNASGMGTFAGVCAECVGDTMANDGVKGGTCRLATQLGAAPGPQGPFPIADHSIDIGMPCDVNRTGTIGGYGGSYSMDCSPTVISGLGPPLQFGGSFSSSGVQVSLSADSPDCTAPGFSGKKCFCGMCADGKTACLSNAECGTGGSCVGASLPTMPTSMDNVPVAGNLCDGGACNWDEQDGTGTCPASVLAPPGMPAPTVGCYPSPTKGSKGADGKDVTITAPGLGQPDPRIPTLYHANTAGARCIAAGSAHESVPVNRQLGLPGLLFQKRNFLIDVKYAEDQK